MPRRAVPGISQSSGLGAHLLCSCCDPTGDTNLPQDFTSRAGLWYRMELLSSPPPLPPPPPPCFSFACSVGSDLTVHRIPIPIFFWVFLLYWSFLCSICFPFQVSDTERVRVIRKRVYKPSDKMSKYYLLLDCDCQLQKSFWDCSIPHVSKNVKNKKEELCWGLFWMLANST